MTSLRLLLGDDHTLVRHGLRKILEGQLEWQVVAEAGDGREAVHQALVTRPDVAVLDIGMPQMNGIEAARQIVRRLPDTRVLILSMHAQEQYVARALEAGATGYLLKDSAGTDLLRAVAAVGAGKAFFSRRIANVMVDGYVQRVASANVVDHYDSLSEREREVFQLVAEGRSNKELADLLGISVGPHLREARRP